MKLLLALLGCCCVAAAAVYTYPLWQPAMVHAVPAAQPYLPGPGSPPAQHPAILYDGPPPAPSATPAPIVVAPLRPPTPAPIAPAPAPWRLAWSALDCRFAWGLMARDLELDTAEVAALKAGTDPRYDATSLPWYETVAARWVIVEHQIAGLCGTSPVRPSSAAIGDALNWLTVAEATHLSNERFRGTNSWDDQWIAGYSRLLVLYREL